MKNRTFITAFTLIAFGLGLSSPLLRAQDEAAPAEPTSEITTQGDFALMFANKLGLTSGISRPLSPKEAINLLTEIGISPFGGWTPAKALTPGDLARMIVQALDSVAEIEAGERDNPETTAYMDYLTRVYDVEIKGTDPSQADFVGAARQPAAGGQFGDRVSSDPLKGRGDDGDIDDLDAGGKSSNLPQFVVLQEEVVRVIETTAPSQGGGGTGQVDEDTEDTTPSAPALF